MTVPETWPRDLCCGGNTSTTTAIRNICSLKTNDSITIRQNRWINGGAGAYATWTSLSVSVLGCNNNSKDRRRTLALYVLNTTPYYSRVKGEYDNTTEATRTGKMRKKNSKQETLGKTGAAAAHRHAHTHTHTTAWSMTGYKSPIAFTSLFIMLNIHRETPLLRSLFVHFFSKIFLSVNNHRSTKKRAPSIYFFVIESRWSILQNINARIAPKKKG